MRNSHRQAILLLAGVLCGVGLSLSCSRNKTADKQGDTKKFNPSQAAVEYQLLQAELKLAATEKPYLVIDFAEKQVRIELKGTLVWSYPLDVSEDDRAEIGDFVDRFRAGSELVRPITQTYLFSGQTKTSDSVLAIISEATRFKPELLQRELPERFELYWGDKVILDVRTDIKGVASDKLKNTMFEIRHALQTPFGKAQLTVKMSSDRALTLFRVAQPGLPTIVIPPKS